MSKDSNTIIIDGKRINLSNNVIWLNPEHSLKKNKTLEYIHKIGIRNYSIKNDNFSVLLNGLYCAYEQGKFLAIPFDNNFYSELSNLKNYEIYKLSRSIKKIVEYLAKNKYITINKGVKNSHTTLLKTEPLLIDIFKNSKPANNDVKKLINPIKMHDKKKRLKDYTDIETNSNIRGVKMNFNAQENKQMIDKLNYINLNYTILLHCDTKYKISSNELLLTTEPTEHKRRYFISLINKDFHRIFNLNFDKGGRYYGHYIQSLSKGERKTLKLKNIITGEMHKVCELDFSNYHAKILYDLIKQPLKFNPYDINGYPRNDTKKLFLIMLNAENTEQAIYAFIKKMRAKQIYYDYKTTVELLNSIKIANEPIKEFFCSCFGIYLQRIDSEIASLILTEFVNKDKPIFAVHDSFIVRSEDKDVLLQAMRQAYIKIMQANPPNIN